jgi:hypothetical protein
VKSDRHSRSLLHSIIILIVVMLGLMGALILAVVVRACTQDRYDWPGGIDPPSSQRHVRET